MSEEDQTDMTLFIKNASIILSTLGYRVLETVVQNKKNKIEEKYTYKFGGLEAKGIVTNDGFVLLKGSQLATEDKFAERWKDKLPILRTKYSEKFQIT